MKSTRTRIIKVFDLIDLLHVANQLPLELHSTLILKAN